VAVGYVLFSTNGGLVDR